MFMYMQKFVFLDFMLDTTIPIIIGNEKEAMNLGEFLNNNGIFVQPIRYPTVPKNQARLRISVTAWLSNKEIEKSLSVFEKAFKRFF